MRAIYRQPCAVVTDADGIEPADMLRIARETNAPETAFVLALRQGGRACPYFMPRETPLRGIPPLPRAPLRNWACSPGTARFEFAIGVLPVDIRPTG
ncbi:MAG: PhzF family phenazine biosynthesis protein [Bilophila wadsworthia]